MPRTFPPDLAQFIQDELESGAFPDEDAVLTAALEVFREMRERHAELRRRVEHSLVQSRSGDVTSLEMADLKQRLINRRSDPHN